MIIIWLLETSAIVQCQKVNYSSIILKIITVRRGATVRTPGELYTKKMVVVASGVAWDLAGLGGWCCGREAVSGELLLFVIRSILWKQALRRELWCSNWRMRSSGAGANGRKPCSKNQLVQEIKTKDSKINNTDRLSGVTLKSFWLIGLDEQIIIRDQVKM